MSAKAPLTGNRAHQPGKLNSASNNATEMSRAAKPTEEIQDRTGDARTIWRGKANAVPTKNSQNRDAGRKKSLAMLVVDSQILIEKDARNNRHTNRPMA